MNISPAKTIHFDEQYLHVELEDERMILTPMKWYPELGKATMKQLKNFHFICNGTGIEWPDLDYHLSIEAMLLGKAQKEVAQDT